MRGKRRLGTPDADVVVTITDAKIAEEGTDSARGWPAVTTVFPIGQPGDFIRGPVFIAGKFRSLAPKHG